MAVHREEVKEVIQKKKKECSTLAEWEDTMNEVVLNFQTYKAFLLNGKISCYTL